MKQLNIFESEEDSNPKCEKQIPGLKYTPNYISKEEEQSYLY